MATSPEGTVPLQHTVSNESQEDGEDDVQSVAWGDISRDDVVVCRGVIEEIVANKDQVPDRIFEAANIISETSLGIRVIMI